MCVRVRARTRLRVRAMPSIWGKRCSVPFHVAQSNAVVAC